MVKSNLHLTYFSQNTNATQTLHPSAQLPQLDVWFRHPYGQTRADLQNHNSSVSWDHDGGTSSLPMSGSQSRWPVFAEDLNLTCSEFTWTLHSHPVPPPPTIVCYTSWNLMYAPNVCCILYSFSSVVMCVSSTVVSLLYTGNRLVRRLSVLGSMNIFTVPIEIYCDTSYDKCT